METETEKLYFSLQDVIRPLASKENRNREENIALTHMQTAALWLNVKIQADKMIASYSAQAQPETKKDG